MLPMTIRLAQHRRRFLRTAGAGLLAVPFGARVASAQGLGGADAAGIAAAKDLPVRATGRPVPKTATEPVQGDVLLPPEARVGFAVVGLGKFALGQILPSFAETERAKPTALVSGNPDKARRVAERYGIGSDSVYGYDDFERIKDNPAIDVVYVILPNALHKAWTLRAFDAGKHVMCEKPMAPTVADCEAMIQAGEDAGKKLMIAYRAQYEPYNLKAMDLARNGALGRLKLITSDHGRVLDPSDPADQWRMRKDLAGGGSLYDIGIYAVQAMRYLSGEEPEEVLAMWHTPKDDPRFFAVEDTVTWQFKMPSGLLTTGSTSYSYKDTKRASVIGTKGGLRLDPATDYDERRLWLEGEDGSTEIELRDANQFALEIDHMARCVREDRTPKTPGEEGLRDVVIMQAIYEAARTGKTVRPEHPLLRRG